MGVALPSYILYRIRCLFCDELELSEVKKKTEKNINNSKKYNKRTRSFTILKGINRILILYCNFINSTDLLQRNYTFMMFIIKY